MDKKLLLEKYVRVAIKKAIQEQEARQKKAEKAMYLIYRFPGLRKSIEELMSPSFGRFITAVDLVAPKPTTFKVTLINGYDYNITYLKKDTYKAKIAGNTVHVDSESSKSQSHPQRSSASQLHSFSHSSV